MAPREPHGSGGTPSKGSVESVELPPVPKIRHRNPYGKTIDRARRLQGELENISKAPESHGARAHGKKHQPPWEPFSRPGSRFSNPTNSSRVTEIPESEDEGPAPTSTRTRAPRQQVSGDRSMREPSQASRESTQFSPAMSAGIPGIPPPPKRLLLPWLEEDSSSPEPGPSNASLSASQITMGPPPVPTSAQQPMAWTSRSGTRDSSSLVPVGRESTARASETPRSENRSIVRAGSHISDGVLDSGEEDLGRAVIEWDHTQERHSASQQSRASSRSDARPGTTVFGSSPPPERERTAPREPQRTKAATERERVDEARRQYAREWEEAAERRWEERRRKGDTALTEDEPAPNTSSVDSSILQQFAKPYGGRPSQVELIYREGVRNGWTEEQIKEKVRKMEQARLERLKQPRIRSARRMPQTYRPPVPWSDTETRCLVRLWYKHGRQWALIQQRDLKSTTPQLQKRTQGHLRDKIRQIEKTMANSGIQIPEGIYGMAISEAELERIVYALAPGP